MTPEKDCEIQVIGLAEPVFVDFNEYIMLMTPDYLIKFDHLFTKKECKIYSNKFDNEYPLPENVKDALINQLDGENSLMIDHSERTTNRKFKKYIRDIFEF